jgi:hypothetical protein
MPATFNSELLVMATSESLERCGVDLGPRPPAVAPGHASAAAGMPTKAPSRVRFDTVGSAAGKLANQTTPRVRPESAVSRAVRYEVGGRFRPVFERRCPMVGSCGDEASYFVQSTKGALPVQQLTGSAVTVADVQELAGGRVYITGDQFDSAAVCVDLHRGDAAVGVDAGRTLVTKRGVLVQQTSLPGAKVAPGALTVVIHAAEEDPQKNGTYQPTLCTSCGSTCGLRVFELPPASQGTPLPTRAIDDAGGHLGASYALFQVIFELPAGETPSFLVDGLRPTTVALDFPKGGGKGRAILQVPATVAASPSTQRFLLVLGDKSHVYDSRVVTLSN